MEAHVDAASLDTKDEGRDTHLRSADFFDVETYPSIDFVSTGVRVENGEMLVDGDLTIRGTTKPVTFEFDFGGFGTDPWGNYKAGATAKTVINREDFGLTWNAALETGGVLVGKDVTITLDLQGALPGLTAVRDAEGDADAASPLRSVRQRRRGVDAGAAGPARAGCRGTPRRAPTGSFHDSSRRGSGCRARRRRPG